MKLSKKQTSKTSAVAHVLDVLNVVISIIGISFSLLGILINNEFMGNKFEFSIAGVGLNVNQKEFSNDIPNPVSLCNITGKEYEIRKLTESLCICLKQRYEQLKYGLFSQIEHAYLNKLLGLNEEREFIFKGEYILATIAGVNEFGHLKLTTSKGLIECDLKEISYII